MSNVWIEMSTLARLGLIKNFHLWILGFLFADQVQTDGLIKTSSRYGQVNGIYQIGAESHLVLEKYESLSPGELTFTLAAIPAINRPQYILSNISDAQKRMQASSELTLVWCVLQQCITQLWRCNPGVDFTCVARQPLHGLFTVHCLFEFIKVINKRYLTSWKWNSIINFLHKVDL